MDKWKDGHPFFRNEEKEAQYKVFTQNDPAETQEDIMERVQTWIKDQKQITIKGSAWGMEALPKDEKDKNWPRSPFRIKYTVTYTQD